MSTDDLSGAKENPSEKRTIFIRFVGRTLLAVMILLAIAIIINWLLITPKNPTYIIENGFIYPYNVTDTKLNATFHFKIMSFNGNRKASIHTVFMKMRATYKDQIVEARILPFSQLPGNQISLNVTASANFVSPFGGLAKVVKEDGIDLALHITGIIRYGVEKWISKSRSMEVYCLLVVHPRDTSRTFERAPCKVDI